MLQLLQLQQEAELLLPCMMPIMQMASSFKDRTGGSEQARKRDNMGTEGAETGGGGRGGGGGGGGVLGGGGWHRENTGGRGPGGRADELAAGGCCRAGRRPGF